MSLNDVKSSMSRVVRSMDTIRAVSELERAVARVAHGDAFGLGELHAHTNAIERALGSKAPIFHARIADVRAQLNKK